LLMKNQQLLLRTYLLMVHHFTITISGTVDPAVVGAASYSINGSALSGNPTLHLMLEHHNLVIRDGNGCTNANVDYICLLPAWCLLSHHNCYQSGIRFLDRQVIISWLAQLMWQLRIHILQQQEPTCSWDK
jgi:hypothetical protein